MALDVASTILDLAQQAEQQKQRDMLQKRAFLVRFYPPGTSMRDVVSLPVNKKCFATLRVAFNHEDGIQTSHTYQTGTYRTGKQTCTTKAVTVPYGQLQYMIESLLADFENTHSSNVTFWRGGVHMCWFDMVLFQLNFTASSAEVVVHKKLGVLEFAAMKAEVLKLVALAKSVTPDP
jgi:hypothetical protein